MRAVSFREGIRCTNRGGGMFHVDFPSPDPWKWSSLWSSGLKPLQCPIALVYWCWWCWHPFLWVFPAWPAIACWHHGDDDEHSDDDEYSGADEDACAGDDTGGGSDVSLAGTSSWSNWILNMAESSNTSRFQAPMKIVPSKTHIQWLH